MSATDNPIIRPLDPIADAEALHQIFGNEESCRFLPRPALASVEETRELLVGWTKGTEKTSWAIIDKQDGPTLGRVSLIPQDDNVWEAAVMLVPDATGRGFATRAMAQALDIVFSEFSARRVFADCDPDNHGSIAIFERLGFQQEGRLREAWTTHIGARDTVIYGLLATDPRPWSLTT